MKGWIILDFATSIVLHLLYVTQSLVFAESSGGGGGGLNPQKKGKFFFPQKI